MANPQPDEFTKVSNELLDALCKTRISGEARQVLDVIFRKTYGFNKVKDAISFSQFGVLTGMPKPTCLRGIKKLETMNIIVVNREKYITEYSIQKDYELWNLLSKKITLSKGLDVIKNDNRTLSKKIMAIDNNDNEFVIKNDNNKRKKETYTKETLKKVATKSFDDESDEIILSKLLFNLMEINNPNVKHPNYQSWAKYIDLMLRVDNRTFHEVDGAIRWSQNNSFWMANILSTKKLREKYDQLFLQAKRNYSNGTTNATISESELRDIAENIANDPRLAD